jgi:hypothetical protein
MLQIERAKLALKYMAIRFIFDHYFENCDYNLTFQHRLNGTNIGRWTVFTMR